MKFAVLAFLAIGVAAGVVTLKAQAPHGVVSTSLQTVDSAIKGYEVVAMRADYEPDGTLDWHTHPGEMVGYVLEGSILLEQQGKPPLTMNAGDAFIVPAGIPHNTTSTGRSRARMHATYIVPKDVPITSRITR